MENIDYWCGYVWQVGDVLGIEFEALLVLGMGNEGTAQYSPGAQILTET